MALYSFVSDSRCFSWPIQGLLVTLVFLLIAVVSSCALGLFDHFREIDSALFLEPIDLNFDTESVTPTFSLAVMRLINVPEYFAVDGEFH